MSVDLFMIGSHFLFSLNHKIADLLYEIVVQPIIPLTTVSNMLE